MSSIRKAIIPAAGLGKRMAPVSDYLAKPMLPLGRKPVLHHIVDELLAAGIQEILVVLRSEHDSVFKYFRKYPELSFAVDDSAGGPGKAILEGEDFTGGESFTIVFADAPLKGHSKEMVLERLINVKNDTAADAVLSVYPIPRPEASSRGVVELEGDLKSAATAKVRNIIEKPEKVTTEKPWASTCRYVVSNNIFDALGNAQTDGRGELQLTSGIKCLLQQDRLVVGVPLPSGIRRYDTGNFPGYFKAFEDFAAEDKS